MTPLKIGLCLHYHSSATDDPWVYSEAPIVDATIEELISDGLLVDQLDPNSSTRPAQRFCPTPKLHAYVAMLEATPMPEHHWLDPRDGKSITGFGVR